MLGQNINSLSFKIIYIESLGLKKGGPLPVPPSPIRNPPLSLRKSGMPLVLLSTNRKGKGVTRATLREKQTRTK